jgi:hypothetical protein
MHNCGNFVVCFVFITCEMYSGNSCCVHTFCIIIIVRVIVLISIYALIKISEFFYFSIPLASLIYKNSFTDCIYEEIIEEIIEMQYTNTKNVGHDQSRYVVILIYTGQASYILRLCN